MLESSAKKSKNFKHRISDLNRYQLVLVRSNENDDFYSDCLLESSPYPYKIADKFFTDEEKNYLGLKTYWRTVASMATLITCALPVCFMKVRRIPKIKPEMVRRIFLKKIFNEKNLRSNFFPSVYL